MRTTRLRPSAGPSRKCSDNQYLVYLSVRSANKEQQHKLKRQIGLSESTMGRPAGSQLCLLLLASASLAVSLTSAQLPPIGSPFFGAPSPSFGSPSLGLPSFPSIRLPPQPSLGSFNPFSSLPSPASWLRPPSFPGFSSAFPSTSFQPRRPPSPARQCRLTGACKQVDHGTTLPASWTVPITTTMTPQPTTTTVIRSTTPRPATPTTRNGSGARSG